MVAIKLQGIYVIERKLFGSPAIAKFNQEIGFHAVFYQHTKKTTKRVL